MKKSAVLLLLVSVFLVSCKKEEVVSIITEPEPTVATQEKEVVQVDISAQTPTEDVMEKEESEDAMTKKEDDVMEKERTMEKSDEDDVVMMEKEKEKPTVALEEVIEKKVALAGTYADYDSSLVGNTENTVVFFHANWCPSCRAADAGISSGEVPSDLTILKADFDSSTDLKKKYGVVAQHTFLQIDANGELVKKWVGGTNVDSITERLN